MESIQIFLKLDGLFEVELNVPAKAIQFIQKFIKNRPVGNVGFWCSYIITQLIIYSDGILENTSPKLTYS